ncbi:transposase [Bifidobacterium longum subsp. longum]|uniref:Transposase n=1 Tax=Bifidobacterium longum subsp. longum TaxID=1679 RepID=A0A4R0VQS1_BIFLL|nr:transposase [Bifidobacterium longum subsp. longum]
MCEARRAEYVRLLDEEGMNFTQAAHAVGACAAWVKFMPSSSSRRTYSARRAAHISFLVGYSTTWNVQRCSPPGSPFRWLVVT